MSYTLFHADSAVSVVPLILLRQLNIAHEVVLVEYDDIAARKDLPAVRRLLAINPLAQVPTLLTPDGISMSESTAIVLYLLHEHGRGTPWDLEKLTRAQLAGFYRLMVVIPAVVYPAIGYEDFPERYIVVPAENAEEGKQAIKWMKAGGYQKLGESYKLVESILSDFNKRAYGADSEATTIKFALGTQTATALDIMLAVTVHYAPHPRPKWLEENCPRLFASASSTVNIPGIVDAFRESVHLKPFIRD
ncbi:hypothetical protein EXIGLDRAFT_773038 [Exidia glandulosa HHB12029]|uniref:Glutathione S-transferase n=1 Tax=Exidia glandulosa HHB12029 TaxID=1314781 RepID=A0A165F071_EXIGL|nr:hypothetical protein EXIGLDRAFT_773038 [Exidia glandulosa HHB12029]